MLAYIPPYVRIWRFEKSSDVRPLANSVEVTGNQVHVLFKHQSANRKDELLSDAALLSVIVIDLERLQRRCVFVIDLERLQRRCVPFDSLPRLLIQFCTPHHGFQLLNRPVWDTRTLLSCHHSCHSAHPNHLPIVNTAWLCCRSSTNHQHLSPKPRLITQEGHGPN